MRKRVTPLEQFIERRRQVLLRRAERIRLKKQREKEQQKRKLQPKTKKKKGRPKKVVPPKPKRKYVRKQPQPPVEVIAPPRKQGTVNWQNLTNFFKRKYSKKEN